LFHYHLILSLLDISFNWDIFDLLLVGFLRDVFDIILNWPVIDILLLCRHLNVALNFFVFSDHSVIRDIFNFRFPFDHFTCL